MTAVPAWVWEKRLAYFILVTTPLFVSPATVDSFILPKYIWLTILVSLWLLLILLQPGEKKFTASAVDLPVAVLSGIFIFSTIIDYQSPVQWLALRNFFVYLALFYCFRRLWSRCLTPDGAVWALFTVATLLAIYGILQDYGVDWANYQGGVRDWRAKVVATIGNPNFLGGYLAAGLPLLSLYVLRRDLPLSRFIPALLCVTLQAACLTLTFCVGALIGLAVSGIAGLVTVILLRYKPKISVFRLAALIIAVLGANMWYTLDNPYNSHGGSLFLEAKQSPQWRTGMGARNFNWRTARIMMDEKPVTGIGFGNYLTLSIHYQGLNYQRYGTAHDRDYVIPVDQPHLELLGIASETGPVGVITACWLFAAWLVTALRRLRSHPRDWFGWGAFLGVMVVTGHSFASFPFHLPATSLIMTFLASYFFAYVPRAASATNPIPAWVKGVCIIFALANVILAYSVFLSDKHLRNASEAEGVQSLDYLKRARAYNPFNYSIHFQLANRYVQLKQYDRALASYREAVKYQEDLKSHEYMARIHVLQNNLSDAITEQRRVIELNPVFPGHYRDLANLLRMNGQDAEAEPLEAKAKALDEEMTVKYARP